MRLDKYVNWCPGARSYCKKYLDPMDIKRCCEADPYFAASCGLAGGRPVTLEQVKQGYAIHECEGCRCRIPINEYVKWLGLFCPVQWGIATKLGEAAEGEVKTQQ